MKSGAIELGNVAALSLLAAGAAFSSMNAGAQEPAQQVAVLEVAKPRVAKPVLAAGGLKAGQVMVIGGGAPEVMSSSAFAQRPIVTPAMKAAEVCQTY